MNCCYWSLHWSGAIWVSSPRGSDYHWAGVEGAALLSYCQWCFSNAHYALSHQEHWLTQHSCLESKSNFTVIESAFVGATAYVSDHRHLTCSISNGCHYSVWNCCFHCQDDWSLRRFFILMLSNFLASSCYGNRWRSAKRHFYGLLSYFGHSNSIHCAQSLNLEARSLAGFDRLRSKDIRLSLWTQKRWLASLSLTSQASASSEIFWQSSWSKRPFMIFLVHQLQKTNASFKNWNRLMKTDFWWSDEKKKDLRLRWLIRRTSRMAGTESIFSQSSSTSLQVSIS